MAHQIRAAVTNRDVATLEKLLSLGTIDINQRLNGSTPLGYVDFQLVNYDLHRNCAVSIADSFGIAIKDLSPTFPFIRFLLTEYTI